MNYLQLKRNALLMAVKKGFLRLASGVAPLTLPDCLKGKLKGLKIYGNSTQNGTPTPENPVEIESVGDLVTDETSEYYGKYKIPVMNEGKNLLNFPIKKDTANGLTIDSTENGIHIYGNATKAFGTAGWLSYIAKLSAGIYSLSKDTINDTRITVQLKHADGTTKYTNTTVTLDGTEKQVMFYISVGASNVGKDVDFWFYPQVELGDTATPYEPYCEPETVYVYAKEPLRKIGDYADVVDLKRGIIERNNTKWVCDNSTILQEWIWANDEKLGYLDFAYDTKPTATVAYSNYFATNGGSLPNKKNNRVGTGFGGVYFGTSDWETPEDLKTFLLENNVEVYYPLATPIEEPVIVSDLPTLSKGTNIIDTDTKVKPSLIEAEYYSDNKGD